MIGQNRQASYQQAKADHDFTEQELELKTNTQLTREIHVLTTELHRRLIDEPGAAGDDEARRPRGENAQVNGCAARDLNPQPAD